MRKGLLIFALVFFNLFVFKNVFSLKEGLADPEVFFLQVGQGDSSLVILPQNVKVLIDGGPDKSVIGELDKILTKSDRRIDIVVLSHANADHFRGLIEVVKRFRVGAFIYNGIDIKASDFQELIKELNASQVKIIALQENDRIKYGDEVFEILSPGKSELVAKDLNETSVVLFLKSAAKVLFTGDIDEKVEKRIGRDYDLKADILKVGHHGSKFSSSSLFLNEIRPLVAILEVGKNSYGHPTKEALNRLAQVGARVLRTDEDGTVGLFMGPEKVLLKKY